MPEVLRVARRPRWAWLVAGALVTVACSGAAPPAEPESASAETAPPPAAPVETPAAAPPATTPAEGLGQAQHEVGGVEVVLQELRAPGDDTVLASWRYRNTSGEDQVLATGSLSWYDPYLLSGGTFLIDLTNKKKYLVITDSEDRPLASQYPAAFGELTLPAGQDTAAWARFPAPPDDVEQVSVYVAGVPPFENVPIAR